MSTFTQTIQETFHVVSCYTCGVNFGIEGTLYRRVVTDATDHVWCPACGKLTAWCESEDKKRIKELERKLVWEAAEVARQKQMREAEKIAREAAGASLRTTKGVVTKLRTRVGNGVCPCCHRTVKQLAAHMKTKHPGFNETPTKA